MKRFASEKDIEMLKEKASSESLYHAMKSKLDKLVPDFEIRYEADIPAESGICCTSGGAAAVVESLGTETVIFLPVEYLASNMDRETGKHIVFPMRTPRLGQNDGSLEYQLIG